MKPISGRIWVNLCGFRLLQILSSNEVAISYLALTYFRAGDISNSIHWIKEAVKVKPYQAVLRLNLPDLPQDRQKKIVQVCISGEPAAMPVSRREFLKLAGAMSLVGQGCSHVRSPQTGVLVNDVQSRLNPTEVARIVRPSSLSELRGTISDAARKGKSVSVCGGRHAMGGQQFASKGVLLDSTSLSRVLNFDREAGVIELEAGMQWPALFNYLQSTQAGASHQWTFAQKQTGANRFCLGGALSANIHSRGLKMKPFISNIEEFTLIDASGDVRICSRKQNSELFNLAIGGYGLFGVVYSLKLRLVQRLKLKRIVEIGYIEDIMAKFNSRIMDGFLYGDFQFAIDPASNDFLRRGVFSCYKPVPLDAPIESGTKIGDGDWLNLLHSAHINPSAAFEAYVNHYMRTNGQIYWSDVQQFSGYIDDFHQRIDERMNAKVPGSEIITEIYVPRQSLAKFMHQASEDFRSQQVKVIYGTVRLIEKDDESFLAWAREPYACIIFNLHADHSPEGLQRVAEAFRKLIDAATALGGKYYLTYHKFATREQVDKCYPEFAAFLALKRKYDPQELFRTDWYAHYKGSY